MPIYRYRSLEAAEKHLKELLPESALERHARLERLLDGLLPHKKVERGIHRFRTLEEANLHRESH